LITSKKGIKIARVMHVTFVKVKNDTPGKARYQ